MENYPAHQAKKSRDFAFLKLMAAWITAIAIALGLQAFVFQSYQVFGQSMEPTLHDGDYLIISKLGPSKAQFLNRAYVPERGDIVVIEPNGSPRLIKRVIGLPGERVVVAGGNLRIFDDEHPAGFDPYELIDVPASRVEGQVDVYVPEGQIFMVGDNREGHGSSDSRNQYGTIPVDNVVGSLVLRLWPAGSIQTF